MTQEKKLKILMVSEASFLSSGFGTYAKEILKRLHATGKYEIAEFACYGKVNDPKDIDIHWKYYANAVDDKDPRNNEYQSSAENQFGRWRFERVLLDFKPDVVFDVRDYWMNSYQQFSPLRPFFHWVLMPTVDSEPQQEEWIDTFLHADAIFTYSDFGRDTLKKQSNNKINYIDTTSPGVDLQTFFPYENRDQIRETFGLDKNLFIIGSVMRNQKRKLIPDLFYATKKLLEKCEKTNNHKLGNNLYLYLHTSYPDAGWDIPQLLKEYKIGNRVLFTYACRSCGYFYPSLFQHPVCVCPRCGQKTCSMPNVSNGISSQNLCSIMNLFDIYVQYAICEGFGMPQIEAASCGVPVASIDYSAMSDVVRKVNGYPIKVGQYFKELETKAIRVFPNNLDFVNIIESYYELPDMLKEQKRFETRKLTEKYYNWDDIANKWMNYLDKIELTGLQGQWDIAIPMMEEISSIPNNISNAYDAITYLVSKHLPNHHIGSSMIMLNMIRDLEYGFVNHGFSTEGYNINKAIDILNTMIRNHNIGQTAKNNPEKLTQEDYIDYAHMKDNIK
jgi:glycosyltransferase involved in cell wall biosynthesis